jgi:hypothetical protein
MQNVSSPKKTATITDGEASICALSGLRASLDEDDQRRAVVDDARPPVGAVDLAVAVPPRFPSRNRPACLVPAEALRSRSGPLRAQDRTKPVQKLLSQVLGKHT